MAALLTAAFAAVFSVSKCDVSTYFRGAGCVPRSISSTLYQITVVFEEADEDEAPTHAILAHEFASELFAARWLERNMTALQGRVTQNYARRSPHWMYCPSRSEAEYDYIDSMSEYHPMS